MSDSKVSDKYTVCRVEDLPPGTRTIQEINGLSIGVFNVGGTFYALLNRCPHKAAPLCRGRVTGLVTAPGAREYALERDGEIVRCPWHGWEFDIATGQSVFNPHRVRTRSFPVSVEQEPIERDDASVPFFPTEVTDGWVTVSLHRAGAGPRDARPAAT